MVTLDTVRSGKSVVTWHFDLQETTMTNKELTSLAIKVFAIYILVQTLMIFAFNGQSMISFFQGIAENLWALMSLLASVLLLITCWILWRMANAIIDKVKTPKQRGDEYRIDQVFFLHLIGFYCICQALIEAIGYSLSLHYMSSPEQFGYDHFSGQKMVIFFNYFAALVQFGIGLSLLIKPYGWARLFQKIRGR